MAEQIMELMNKIRKVGIKSGTGGQEEEGI